VISSGESSSSSEAVPAEGQAVVRVPGEKIMIYASGSGKGAAEFRARANEIGASLGADIYPAETAQDIIDIVRKHDRIELLVFFGHGVPKGFLWPGKAAIRISGDNLPNYASANTFASELAPRLNQGAVIGIAACLTGADSGEVQDWGAHLLGPGGANSFAAKLRDELASQLGIKTGIEIRAHTTAAHTTRNPYVRYFTVVSSEIGKPGKSLLDKVWGTGSYESRNIEWANLVKGDVAEDWISGGDISVA
jgi:hypothetical protein